MRNLNKILLVFVVLVILGLIGYKLFHKNKSAELTNSNQAETSTVPEQKSEQQQSQKVGNTKVLQTSSYQIKYPEGWITESKTLTPLASLDTLIKDNKPAVTILVYSKGYTENNPKALLDEIDMEINGEYATRQIITDTDGVQKNRIRVQHNGKTYLLTLENSVYLEQFNSMLPTFKFIK